MFWLRKLVKFPAHIASKDWVCEEEPKRVPLEGLFVLAAVASAAAADVLAVAVIATVVSISGVFLADFRGFFDTDVTNVPFKDCLRAGEGVTEGVDGFADREDRFSGVMVKATLNLVCNE